MGIRKEHVDGDTNGRYDVFLTDTQTGETTRISVGQAGEEANLASFAPVVSSDGTLIAFSSDATNISLDGDTNGSTDDIFAYKTGAIPIETETNTEPTAFTEVTDTAGVGLTGTSSESVAWGDYDNDGDDDLYITCLLYTSPSPRDRG